MGSSLILPIGTGPIGEQMVTALISQVVLTILPMVLLAGMIAVGVSLWGIKSGDLRKLSGVLGISGIVGIWAVGGSKGLWTSVILLGILVLAGVARRVKSTRCSSQRGKPEHFPDIETLDWHQLERLVGRYFKSEGYRVTERGGQKADGGIDLIIEGETDVAIQCKHWKKWTCGPDTIRELIGAMSLEKLPSGIVICREATEAAKKVAVAGKVAIWEREDLNRRLQAWPDFREAVRTLGKPCPRCGAELVLKKPKNGNESFWGCSNYPKCRGTMRA